MEFERLGDVRNIRDLVADAIRRAIIEGRLKPGERISERDLSAQMGVSTTPIKEAFRRLEAEHLLVTRARSGTFVSEFSRQNLEQVAYIRSALEGVAAYFAAQNVTEEEIERMRRIISRCSELVESGKYEELADCNVEFHTLIRDASRNQYLIQVIHNLREFDMSFRRVALTEQDERITGFQEHDQILKALVSRDAERAERLMREHIRRSASSVLRRNPDKQRIGEVGVS